MTCQDFRAIVNRQFHLSTAAERSAVVSHCRECPSCLALLAYCAAVEEAKMTPEQLVEVDRRVDETFAKDMLDPEVQL